MRSSAPAALLALALLGIPAAGAAAPSVDPSCGTPLGLEAANGSNSPLERAGDPEYDAVDALRLPGAQRSPGAVVSAWGRLVLIAEAKVDQGTNFTWGIFARIHSNVTGWNTPAVWLSSPNTTQAYPAGVHVRPSAALFGERVWVAWDAQGSGLGSPGDRMILLRAIDSAGAASPAVRASETSASATTQHAVLHASSDGLVLAYSTSEGDGAVGDTHIVVRTFDGSTFGPTVAISNVSDGLSDALPALADDGAGGLVAAWTATDASGSSTRLMFARYSGGSWAAPLAVAELGSSPSSAPAFGHVGGHLFLAYSTTHAPDLNGTDSDVMVTAYDLGSGGFVPAVRVNPEPSNGDDTAPTLSRVGDLLYVGWSTDEDFYYAAGSDTDAVYRTLDGNAFGPVVSLSDPALNNSDASPRFVGVGSHVYAHWMVTPPPVAGAPRVFDERGGPVQEAPLARVDDDRQEVDLGARRRGELARHAPGPVVRQPDARLPVPRRVGQRLGASPSHLAERPWRRGPRDSRAAAGRHAGCAFAGDFGGLRVGAARPRGRQLRAARLRQTRRGRAAGRAARTGAPKPPPLDPRRPGARRAFSRPLVVARAQVEISERLNTLHPLSAPWIRATPWLPRAFRSPSTA